MRFQQEDKLLNVLKKKIDKRPLSKNLVAMDADGTLWPEDANNILLEYEIKNNLRDLSDLLDLRYRSDGFRYKRCELFAERQAGFTLQEFKSYCHKALSETSLHIFPFQRELLKYIKQKSMKVFIVTASVQWLVEAAVELYNLPVDGVLGVQTKLEESIITEELLRPAPIAGFKAEVFLKHNKGIPCFLAGGNTSSDIPLLEMAEAPFVVHSADRENENFSAEKRLKKMALKNNWIVFQK